MHLWLSCATGLAPSHSVIQPFSALRARLIQATPKWTKGLLLPLHLAHWLVSSITKNSQVFGVVAALEGAE